MTYIQAISGSKNDEEIEFLFSSAMYDAIEQNDVNSRDLWLTIKSLFW